MASISVCVIGAGPLGLTATKNFIEEGFDVTGFETRDYIGGLWKESFDSSISVHKVTRFNSSKWRTPYSDFPFEDDADVYPTAGQIYTYLQQYADHFNLRQHYQLSTTVLNIEFVAKRQQWAVTVQDLSSPSRDSRVVYFDKVCVATGSFYTPRWPELQGIEKFQGRTLHSLDFHDANEFKGQNVLLIGLHATASDVCCALSESANKVYASHRAGLLLLPRYVESGSAIDTAGTVKNTLAMAFMMRHCSQFFFWMVQRMMTKVSRSSFSPIPESWGLSPAPSLAVATPMIADELWPHLQSGFVEPVTSIKQILGPKQVELSDDRILDDIDTIIYCTGYHFALPDGLISHATDENNPESQESVYFNPYQPIGSGDPMPKLYRNIFPFHESKAIRESLAFLGHGYVVFPGFVQFELQTLAIAQVWKGNTEIPSWSGVQAWYANHLEHRETLKRRYHVLEGSTFYPGILDLSDHLPWLDQAAGGGLYDNIGGMFGGLFNPRAWSLWWKDRKLYRLLMNGVFSPAIWRLFDTGKRRSLEWETARAIIISQNEKAEAARIAKLQELSDKKVL